MCHIVQSSQGGVDELDNVVMFCRFHHGVFDNRVQNGRREAIVDLWLSFASMRRSMNRAFGVGEYG